MRIIKLNKGKLTLKENDVDGFLERVVNPKKYLGRRVYIIVTKKKIRTKSMG